MLIIVTKAHSGPYTMQVNNWTDVFLSSHSGSQADEFLSSLTRASNDTVWATIPVGFQGNVHGEERVVDFQWINLGSSACLFHFSSAE